MFKKLGLLSIIISAYAFTPVMAEDSSDFSPATYSFYDQTRSLDQTSKVLERSKKTRKEFANERFVASSGEDNWAQLESLWKHDERNSLWAADQVLLEDL